MFEHIPSFDGNDWHAFITVFERHLHRRNPPSPLRLDLLEMKLSGEAFQAYGTSASYISTYEELRDFLQARFGCRITAQIRRTELFNMKQKSDETLVDYASRIKFVAGEGYPDSSNRQRSELEIAAFLQGLAYRHANVGTSGCAHWFMLGVLFWSIIAGVSYVYQLVCCQSGI